MKSNLLASQVTGSLEPLHVKGKENLLGNSIAKEFHATVEKTAKMQKTEDDVLMEEDPFSIAQAQGAMHVMRESMGRASFGSNFGSYGRRSVRKNSFSGEPMPTGKSNKLANHEAMIGGDTISEIKEGDSEEVEEDIEVEHDYDIARLKEADNQYYKPVKKLIDNYLKKNDLDEDHDADILIQSKFLLAIFVQVYISK